MTDAVAAKNKGLKTMPRPTFVNCAFDPDLCPLLRGLTPDEQKVRMQTDPIIRACVRSVEGGANYPAECATAIKSAKASRPKKTAQETAVAKAAPARSKIAAGA